MMRRKLADYVNLTYIVLGCYVEFEVNFVAYDSINRCLTSRLDPQCILYLW